MVVLLMEASVLGTGFLGERGVQWLWIDINNLLYIDFPSDCEVEYLNLEATILHQLHLEWDC